MEEGFGAETIDQLPGNTVTWYTYRGLFFGIFASKRVEVTSDGLRQHSGKNGRLFFML